MADESDDKNSFSELFKIIDAKLEKTEKIIQEAKKEEDQEIELLFNVSKEKNKKVEKKGAVIPLFSVTNAPGNEPELEENDTLFNIQNQKAHKAKLEDQDFLFGQSDSASLQSFFEDRKEGCFFFDEDMQEVYSSVFSNKNFYSDLASFMEKRFDDAPGDGYKDKLNYLLSGLEFATIGARKEYFKALDSGGALEEKEQEALQEKVVLFEKTRDWVASLTVLENNQYWYTKNYYEKRKQELLTLFAQENPHLDSHAFSDALDKITDHHLTQGIHPSKSQLPLGEPITGFDATLPKFDIGKIKKKIKIEHAVGINGKLEVKGEFSYKRKALLDGNSIFNKAEDEYAKFKSQISDFVTVGIGDYKKGTRENPVDIQFHGINMSEAALGLAMEYKRRAIQDGKTFHCQFGENIIKITPEMPFSAEEEKYFLHFAMQKPQYNRGQSQIEAKHSAGYFLLRHEKLGIDSAKQDNAQEIGEALQKYFRDYGKQYQLEQSEKMEAVAAQLSSISNKKLSM